jgi:hypothetical protein
VLLLVWIRVSKISSNRPPSSSSIIISLRHEHWFSNLQEKFFYFLNNSGFYSYLFDKKSELLNFKIAQQLKIQWLSCLKRANVWLCIFVCIYTNMFVSFRSHLISSYSLICKWGSEVVHVDLTFY